MKKVTVAIIGAGSAGLAARREVEKVTQDYVVIDGGPLGTTCARVGCMPSKVFIQAANDFHRRFKLKEEGILSDPNWKLDTKALMNHTRKLRDRFVRGVMGDMENWTSTHLIQGWAEFVDEHTIEVNGEKIKADRFIIATGSSPIIPKPWQAFRKNLLTTDEFFELEDLPKSIAVIGLGVIGVELGQALSRTGIQTYGITLGKAMGGLTDPEIQDYASKTLEKEFKIDYSGVKEIEENSNGLKITTNDGNSFEVEKALVAIGRSPNYKNLKLENTSIELQKNGSPLFDNSTMKIKGSKNLFIAGDVNGDRPILHEASDEGRIAGYNACRDKDQCFRRRTNLGITFSSPNIATVGKNFAQLKESGVDFVTGSVSFEGQGRSIVKLEEKGLLHLYADKNSGVLLGSELIAPDGEHLAHLLAWAIEWEKNVFELLSLPYYHPVVEEGLRTAIRNLSRQVTREAPPLETLRCEEPAIEGK